MLPALVVRQRAALSDPGPRLLAFGTVSPTGHSHGLTTLCLQHGGPQSRNGGRRQPGLAPTPGSAVSLPPSSWNRGFQAHVQGPPCMLTLELGVKGVCSACAGRLSLRTGLQGPCKGWGPTSRDASDLRPCTLLTRPKARLGLTLGGHTAGHHPTRRNPQHETSTLALRFSETIKMHELHMRPRVSAMSVRLQGRAPGEALPRQRLCLHGLRFLSGSG